MRKLDGPFIAPLSGKAKQVVVLLHGYGANGGDLLSLGTEWQEELPDAAFVSPNAPDICDAFSAGYQWFPIRAVEKREIEREKQVQNVVPVLNSFLDEQLKKWSVDDSALAVAGFSQGAMMAMYAMPRRARPCAAIVGYSGMLIDAEGLRQPGIVKVPVLAIHGDADTIVAPDSLKDVEKGFSEAGFEVETVMRPGLAHGIDHFGVMRGGSFIAEGFEKAQKSYQRPIQKKL